MGYNGPGLFPATDTITIGGVQPPGQWILTGAPKVFGWDVRKGVGLSGATVVPTGDELIESVFIWNLWDDADYPLALAFRKTYLKKALIGVPGAAAAMALSVDHPELKALGGSSCVVKKLTPFTNDGYGLWSCEVTFLQYRRPVPALPKPNAAIPDVTAPQPTAQDAQEQQLQQLAAQFQALAGPVK